MKHMLSDITLLTVVLLISGVSCFTSLKARAFSTPKHLQANIYDEWTAGGCVDTLFLSEENVVDSLDDLVQSDYGQTMFGCHDATAAVDITGDVKFVELHGPQVILSLQGAFWHRRSTVLRQVAVWLNARMPEITDVMVEDENELKDFDEIRDEDSGEVLDVEDKRSPDFNGDRATMEYQGLDPDERGPFPPSVLGSGRITINPT